MLPLTQQLKAWRHLRPLQHYYRHHRLLSSTPPKPESDDTVEQEHSFGRLAARTPRNSTEKNLNEEFNLTTKFSKHQRKFLNPDQQNSDSWRNVYQDNIPEERQQYRDIKYRYPESQARRGTDQKGDAEDYNYFVSKRVSRSQEAQRSFSHMEVSSHGDPEAQEIFSSGGTSQESVKEEEMFERQNLQPEEMEDDEGDLREERYQNAKLERKHRPAFYGFKMKRLCKERKLREAIKVLEEEMPMVGAKPDHFCFQVLINACGRAGYTKKAFQLYNKMKDRRLKVEPFAYTGLFVACANSPWPTTDGLQRAKQLRSQLQEKNFQFNQIICHAMIKAFGWCGDIGTAFQVVDDMIQDEIMVTTETMNFLLQACITNKEIGFRHAIKVWRKMRELKLRPDIHSYNLLMRVVKECGAGDPNFTSDLLKEENTNKPKQLDQKDSPRNQKRLTTKILEVKTLNSEKNVENVPEVSDVHPLKTYPVLDKVKNSSDQVVLPNVIAKTLSAGDVVALGALDKPSDRLAILGGPRGILRQMRKDRVFPNLKTFTQMLESLPPDTQVEQALLESMKILKFEPDTQFFNMLIKKRNFRNDPKAAKDVVEQMQEYHLIPDLITFGCLALGCQNIHSAFQFLRDMDASNFRPNLEIMSTLVKKSIVKQDYMYTVAMMKEMQHRNILPNDDVLMTLEQTRQKIQKSLLNKVVCNNKKEKSPELVFLSAYKTWLKDSKVDLPEHPWAQYR